MRGAAGLLLAAALAGCSSGGGAPTPPPPAPRAPLRFPFEDAPAAGLPAGLSPVSGKWAVVEDATGPSPGKALEQSATVDPWAEMFVDAGGKPLRDFRVSVAFKPVGGLEDASGGILFRCRGPGNGYLVRANALETNFRMYVLGGGRRWTLAEVELEAPAFRTWHTIEVEAVGDRLRAALDGKWLLEAKDQTYPEGSVGLWTKADSVTRFDDLSIEAR